ncbi:hypothetical protein E2C01_085643 [Portunus trituberculatus]|uniref:Uncharacterized protein n=1 Tax=Portunus trituberculatus TaxID=210409 RepID=A0A5B7J9G3_PORTR|nr:hypothetical protein [Portunus trituberculatus]
MKVRTAKLHAISGLTMKELKIFYFIDGNPILSSRTLTLLRFSTIQPRPVKQPQKKPWLRFTCSTKSVMRCKIEVSINSLGVIGAVTIKQGNISQVRGHSTCTDTRETAQKKPIS